MSAPYFTPQKNSSPESPSDPSPAEIVAELEADHRRELRKLADIAFAFLSATDGDSAGDAIDLLFEGSAAALSLWRYRIILAVIREGL